MWVAFLQLFPYFKAFLFITLVDLLWYYYNHVISCIMMQTNRISKNNLVGYCEIDLLELLTQVNNRIELLLAKICVISGRVMLLSFTFIAIIKPLAYMLKASLFLSCQVLDKENSVNCWREF